MSPCTSPSSRLHGEPCQPPRTCLTNTCCTAGPGRVLSRRVLRGVSKPGRDEWLPTINSWTLGGFVMTRFSHPRTGHCWQRVSPRLRGERQSPPAPSCCTPPPLGSTRQAGGRKIKAFVATFPQLSLHTALLGTCCPVPVPTVQAAPVPGRSSPQEPPGLCTLHCPQLLMPQGGGTCLGGPPGCAEQPHHVPSFALLLGSQEDGRASGTHRVAQPTPCHL